MSPNAQPVTGHELSKDRLHPVWIWGLTLFIVFHLSVLLLTPNSENYFGYRLRPWFQPYVSFFEFSGDWKFFSPDPAPKLELEWSVLDQSGAVIQAGKYPDFENPFIIADRGLRRVASLRFMLMREGSLKKMWVPYLCHRYPGAFLRAHEPSLCKVRRFWVKSSSRKKMFMIRADSTGVIWEWSSASHDQENRPSLEALLV